MQNDIEGAIKKQILILLRHFFTFFISAVIFTPSSCKTSEEPDLDETALFPCFATFIPHAEAKMAVAVEIFRVSFPSPPVPQVSKIFFPPFIFLDFFLILLRLQKFLLLFLPFVAKAINKPAVCISESFPEIICVKCIISFF